MYCSHKNKTGIEGTNTGNPHLQSLSCKCKAQGMVLSIWIEVKLWTVNGVKTKPSFQRPMGQGTTPWTDNHVTREHRESAKTVKERKPWQKTRKWWMKNVKLGSCSRENTVWPWKRPMYTFFFKKHTKAICTKKRHKNGHPQNICSITWATAQAFSHMVAPREVSLCSILSHKRNPSPELAAIALRSMEGELCMMATHPAKSIHQLATNLSWERPQSHS